MSFICTGYLPFCPTKGTSNTCEDGSNTAYGAGTNHPLGYSLTAIMQNYWQLSSISGNANANWYQSQQCDGTPCPNNPHGGGQTSSSSLSDTNPRSAVSKMSDLICGTNIIDLSPVFYSDTSFQGYSFYMDFSDILTDRTLTTNSDWLAATYYPLIYLYVTSYEVDNNGCTGHDYAPYYGAIDCSHVADFYVAGTLTVLGQSGDIYSPYARVQCNDPGDTCNVTITGTYSLPAT